jgi:hypothetical protein
MEGRDIPNDDSALKKAITQLGADLLPTLQTPGLSKMYIEGVTSFKSVYDVVSHLSQLQELSQKLLEMRYLKNTPLNYHDFSSLREILLGFIQNMQEAQASAKRHNRNESLQFLQKVASDTNTSIRHALGICEKNMAADLVGNTAFKLCHAVHGVKTTNKEIQTSLEEQIKDKARGPGTPAEIITAFGYMLVQTYAAIKKASSKESRLATEVMRLLGVMQIPTQPPQSAADYFLGFLQSIINHPAWAAQHNPKGVNQMREIQQSLPASEKVRLIIEQAISSQDKHRYDPTLFTPGTSDRTRVTQDFYDAIVAMDERKLQQVKATLTGAPPPSPRRD